MDTIYAPEAPAAVGPYAHAVAAGPFVFCSGQAALHPETMELVGEDVGAQTRQVLANLEAVLRNAGLSLQNVVKTSVFLKNMDDFAAMNAVYAEVFGPHRPARTTVEAARLPKDALVEIDCIAERASLR
jgi:2-iminobutanoate/2-iminopropanoate deaminase